MKKIILLFVMVFAVAGVQAKTNKYSCNVTFPKDASSNCSYNTSTNVFSWTAGNSNSMKIFNSIKGNVDLSEYKYLVVKPTNLSGSYRILIYCDNNGSTTSFIGTYSEAIRLDLTGITLTTSGHTYANINNICIAGSGNSGNLTITEDEVYLETAEYEGNETSFSSLTTGGTWSNSLASLPLHVYKNGNAEEGKNLLLVGKDSGVGNYAEVGNVHAIIFKIRDITTVGGGAIRAFVCKEGDSNFTTVWAYPVSTTGDITWTAQPSQYSTEGYYYIDLTSWDRLVGIKTNSFSSATDYYISEVYLVKKALNITDGFDMADMVNDPVGATVAYDRTFTVGRKSTVCLPFALTADEVSAAGVFYELTDYNGTTLTFSPVTETVAYKPYLFEAKTTGTPFCNLANKEIVASAGATTSFTTANNNGYTATITGTLNHQTVNGKYGWNSTNGEFSKATSDAVTIDAFRAYIEISGVSSARALTAVFTDGTTGIETVNREPLTVNQAYNLQGQRVSEGHKGLVIKNGRKYVVK